MARTHHVGDPVGVCAQCSDCCDEEACAPTDTIPVKCCDMAHLFPATMYADTPGGSATFGTIPPMTDVPITDSLFSPDVYWWRSGLIDIGPYTLGGGRLMIALATVSCSDATPGSPWQFAANLYQNDLLHPLQSLLIAAAPSYSTSAVDCNGMDVTLTAELVAGGGGATTTIRFHE